MGNRAMCAIVIIILVTIFSSVYGHGSKHLENSQFSFSHEGNNAANVSGCTDVFANNYNQNATQDDGTCIYHAMGGYEISESLYEPGMMKGLKFNTNGSKYAILQGDDVNRVPKIIVGATDDNANVIEIQLSAFDLPIDFDWSPDGKQFAVLFRNLDVITFDSKTGNVTGYLFDLNSSSCQSCYNYVGWGEISYNPDGTLISVLTKFGNVFYLDDFAYGFVINTSTKEIVKLFSEEYGPSVGTWSPDGNHFAFQSENLTSIVLFDTKTWEIISLNIPSYDNIYSMDYSPNGELIAVCYIDRLHVYNTSSLAEIWASNISYCWDIDWSSNSDYLGLTQSSNYGWTLTWSSGPDGWEWYSDGSSITIYNTSTGETVDRLTYGNGNLCPTCESIFYFEWHPSDDYQIISGGTTTLGENYENSVLRKDTWNFNKSVEITFGCMEIYSTNYNPNATRSDGSCTEFDERDVNRYRADEYVTTVGLYYAFWDYCEWSDYEKEYLCWVFDLEDLSDEAIDELEDCEQSRNGCETEPYCEEIPYGFWGCTNYIPEYWTPPSSDDDQQSFFGYVDEFGKTVFLLISIIIIFVVMILNMSEKDSRMSKIEIQQHKDGPVNEEVIEASAPKTIEINLRELN